MDARSDSGARWALWLAATLPAPASAAIDFSASAQDFSAYTSTHAILADADGDGDPDLFLANRNQANRILANDAGVFTDTGQDLGTRTGLQRMALADLDGNARPDLFIVESDGSLPYNRVWLNPGPTGGQIGTFAQTAQFFGFQQSERVVLGDVDGDGDADAITAGLDGIRLLLNQGDATFFETTAPFVGTTAAVALGDFDGDTDLDVIQDHGSGAGLRVLFNQGGVQGGTAGELLLSDQVIGPFCTGNDGVDIALGDLDGDGDLDALVANTSRAAGCRDRVVRNVGNASGTFQDTGQSLGPAQATHDVALADFDADGDLDAFLATEAGGRVLAGSATATLTDTGLTLGTRAFAATVGDHDGDGDQDVFVAAGDGGVASGTLWINQSTPFPTIPAYTLRPVAGNGTAGDGGDGGPALAAQLRFPNDVSVDGAGNLYIADTANHRVRRVSPGGTITTVAGTGTEGYAGDGGPATAAQLADPRALAFDSAGNLYIADSSNKRIRRVATDGTISTFAGSGPPGFNGFGGDGGPALAAEFSTLLRGLAFAPDGALLVADSFNYRIRRIGANGIVSTVAGMGVEGYGGDGGPATAAMLGSIRKISYDSAGNLLIADTSNQRIRAVDPLGGIATVAGTGVAGFSGDGGPPLAARLHNPNAAVRDAAGNLWIADAINHRIRRVSIGGSIATIAGTGGLGSSGDGGPALAAALDGPSALLVAGVGDDVLFVDSNANRVRRLAPGSGSGSIALRPRFTSTPAPGSTIDLGTACIPNENDPCGTGGSVSRDAPIIGNLGTTDLHLLSAVLVAADPALSIRLTDLTDPLGSDVTLPFALPGGLNNTRLTVKPTCTPATTGAHAGTLRITTDDPDTPVADYALRCSGTEAAGDEISLFLAAFGVGGAGASVRGPVRSKGPSQSLACTEQAQFDVAPDSGGSVTTRLPAFLGGGGATLTQFAGQFAIALAPLPNRVDECAIRVLGGQFTAASFALPFGAQTGPNTLTFRDPALSGGVLDLATSTYAAYANATIVNDLFPGGFRVEGHYTGTLDLANQRITVQSASGDFFDEPSGTPLILVSGFEAP